MGRHALSHPCDHDVMLKIVTFYIRWLHDRFSRETYEICIALHDRLRNTRWFL
jgi:hypothetical protein